MPTDQTHSKSRCLCVEEAVSTTGQFKIMGDYAVFRPSGQVTLDDAVEMVTAAIGFARTQNIPKLLVIISGLTGFDPPAVSTRYFYFKKWAAASGGAVRVALVDRPEMIDPQKFDVMVAANSGLISEVFTSEDEALAWL